MHVLIIGSGIVGAAIAYELSQRPDIQQDVHITVLDRQPTPVLPDQKVCATATGAALGVLMGAISTKEKGRNLTMRLAGIDWYDRIIPTVEALTGKQIPVNRQGLLMLQFEADRLALWERLVTIRQTQQRRLEIWDAPTLQQTCPHINQQNLAGQSIVAGIYSPDDRQIQPVPLTQALIAAAQKQGVRMRFGEEVQAIEPGETIRVVTNLGVMTCDRLVIAAGLGSLEITQQLQQPLIVKPVLGQAIHLRLDQPLGNPDFQPVLTGDDIHLVPLGGGDYWVGATVEFESDQAPSQVPNQPQPELFATLMAEAIALWPKLAQAEPIRHWYGLRPRPEGRSAPVIEPLAGHSNILLATAHYRNGVLLAPATAMAVADWLS